MALWADDYEPAMALLRRIFPRGLLHFLRDRRPVPSASAATSSGPPRLSEVQLLALRFSGPFNRERISQLMPFAQQSSLPCSLAPSHAALVNAGSWETVFCRSVPPPPRTMSCHAFNLAVPDVIFPPPFGLFKFTDLLLVVR